MADNEQPRYMIACEKRLARLWVQDDGESVEEVARSLRRNRSSIWILLADELDGRVGAGRKKALDESGKDRLVALTDRTAKKAGVRWLVSAEMIQQKHHTEGQCSHASRASVAFGCARCEQAAKLLAQQPRDIRI